MKATTAISADKEKTTTPAAYELRRQHRQDEREQSEADRPAIEGPGERGAEHDPLAGLKNGVDIIHGASPLRRRRHHWLAEADNKPRRRRGDAPPLTTAGETAPRSENFDPLRP